MQTAGPWAFAARLWWARGRGGGGGGARGPGGGGGARVRRRAPPRSGRRWRRRLRSRMAASALYACTKCTQRYPFEELSQGQQLCKVRGRWAAGGRGFLGQSPRELGVRCTAARLSSPAPWGLGALSCLLTRDPFIRGRGHQMGGAPEGKTKFCLLPVGPGGGRAPTNIQGSQGWG